MIFAVHRAVAVRDLRFATEGVPSFAPIRIFAINIFLSSEAGGAEPHALWGTIDFQRRGGSNPLLASTRSHFNGKSTVPRRRVWFFLGLLFLFPCFYLHWFYFVGSFLIESLSEK
jgi:hypothetical protein